MKYYLNIGSNIGDRRDNLYCAVVALARGSQGVTVSRVVESEPWGFESQNSFMNLGICLHSDLSPRAMLDRIHVIERQLGSASHRDAEGRYVDRLIDIDIMAIGDLVIDTRGSREESAAQAEKAYRAVLSEQTQKLMEEHR